MLSKKKFNKSQIVYIKIASFVIRISFLKIEKPSKNKFYFLILTYLSGFKLNKKPKTINFSINLFIENKNFYQVDNNKRTLFVGVKNMTQFKFVILSVLERLFKNRGFILHASASNIDNKAVIFLGNSGAGKSTAMLLLHKIYPGLADDTVIIKKEKKGFFVYQCPFLEKNNIFNRTSKSYPLRAIFILHKAPFFKIKKIKNKILALKKISKQFWLEKKYLKSQTSCLINFVNEFGHIYDLYFAKDENGLRSCINEIFNNKNIR